MSQQLSLSLHYISYPFRYLLVFFGLFALSLSGYLLCSKILNKEAKPEIMARITLIDVVITILIVTIISTLNGNIPGVASLDLVPFHTLEDVWVMGDGIKYFSVVMNVIMFMPLGFLLPLVLKKFQHWYCTLPFCMAFSILIEFLQFFIGRSSDIDDVLANSLGALLGYLFFSGIKMHLRHQARKRRKARSNYREKQRQNQIRAQVQPGRQML